MDNNVKMLVIVGVGGVAVYLLYQGNYLQQWFPSLFPAATPATPATPAAATTPAATAAQIAAAVTSAGTPAQIAAASASSPASSTSTTTPAVIPATPAAVITPTATPAAVSSAVSQLMLAAATAAGEPNNLNMDQWNYYYSQVTGSASPVDPGAIPPGVYAGAFGAPGDRTTPTDVGTWLALMQNQAPQLGLTGIGDLGYLGMTSGWLT